MSEPKNTLRAIRERAVERPGWLEQEPKDVHLAMQQAHNDVVYLLQRFGAHEEPDAELGYTPPMVVSFADEQVLAHCGDCNAPLGSIRPDGSLDTLAANWERHVMAQAHDG